MAESALFSAIRRSIAEFSEITTFDRDRLMEKAGVMIDEILENYSGFSGQDHRTAS